MKNTQKIKGVIIQNEASSKVIFQMEQAGTNAFLVPLDETNYNNALSIAGGSTQSIGLGNYECGSATWFLHLWYPNCTGNPWLTGNEQYMYDKDSHLYARYKLVNYSQGAKLEFLGIEAENAQKIKGVIIQNEASSKVIFQMEQAGTNAFLVPLDETNYNNALSIAGGSTQSIGLGNYECGSATWFLHLWYPNCTGNPWLTGNEQYMYNKDSHLYARYKLVNYSQGAKLVYLGIETEYSKPKEDDTYYPTPMTFVEDDNDSDFTNANRGFVTGTNLTEAIENSNNGVAWDMPSYSFLDGVSPKSVHKNLWRMEKLNNINGIFQVWPMTGSNATDNDIKSGEVFQARSYDLSTMSIIKVADHQWALIDPLLGPDTAIAAWETFKSKVDSEAKICAIMITHSHVDHYKGVSGLIKHEKLHKVPSEKLNFIDGQDYVIDVKEKRVVVIAPVGFYDESISENLYLGNCMGRRAQYMYGSALPRGIFGAVGSGLGKTVSNQVGDIPVPSLEIPFSNSDVQKITINGKEFVFQNVPGTEAPAEMHIGFKANESGGNVQILCPGENVCHTMHNLLTPRGAKVRDAKAFGNAIDRAMEIYPNVEVLIGTHHWPTWGQDECKKILEKQRDMYYFFNNQVIHMLNSGYNMEEIAEKFTLPESLGNEFYNRGYYGTMNHDTKAVVQRYIGWWDGNPANYFKYPEEEVAKRFVNDMGGEDKVLSKARDYYSKHDYRWTVELTRNIVFANPENDKARKLEADALEQLAYSFEGGTWRNIFLAGAYELRGIPQGKSIDKGKIILSIGKNMESLTPKCIFEYLSILIDGNEASKYKVDMTCKIANESFSVYLKNGVLHSKAIADTNCDYVFDSTKSFALHFVAYMERKSSSKYDKLNQIFDCVEIQNPQWNIIEPLS